MCLCVCLCLHGCVCIAEICAVMCCPWNTFPADRMTLLTSQVCFGFHHLGQFDHNRHRSRRISSKRTGVSKMSKGVPACKQGIAGRVNQEPISPPEDRNLVAIPGLMPSSAFSWWFIALRTVVSNNVNICEPIQLYIGIYMIGMQCTDDIQFIALYSFALSALWLKITAVLAWMQKGVARAAHRSGTLRRARPILKVSTTNPRGYNPFTIYIYNYIGLLLFFLILVDAADTFGFRMHSEGFLFV